MAAPTTARTPATPAPRATTTARTIDPTLVLAAKKHASQHRAEIEASSRCACFFCFRTYPNTEIKAWIDGKQTALCPRCGVDSVLGSASTLRLDDAFLRGMHQAFFVSGKR